VLRVTTLKSRRCSHRSQARCAITRHCNLEMYSSISCARVQRTCSPRHERLGCRQAFHPVWIWYRMKAYEPGTCRHLILKLAILVAWGSCEADHYGSHLPIPGTPSRNLLALRLRVQTLRHRPSAKHQHRYALLHFIKHQILFRHRLAHDAPIIIKLGSAHLCVSLMAIMHCRQRMRTQALPLNESYAYLGVQGLLLAHQSLSQSKAERTLAVSR